MAPLPSRLARFFLDYIAGQSIVLPGQVEQTGPSLLVRFGRGPFPELRSQLAVVRQAFSLGHTSGRRSQIVHRESAWRYIGCNRLSRESTVAVRRVFGLVGSRFRRGGPLVEFGR